ncbi:hypothetical protein BOX15_Mlig009254g1 [Macrostomum lignano]|uniref:Sulfotransferase domain-containing protein n=1 Tax=Macrostomum lignano TaxID=282301 RepID=A0A267GE11_9PLAT|nr:hypothetical protein BOX15_Mlig009254g1 [Macrostomum lignano]
MSPRSFPRLFMLLHLTAALVAAVPVSSSSAGGVNSTSQPIDATFARRLPQALIIGAKKSGTRALLAFICMHPDVQAPGPEVHFFDRNYHRGLDWYRKRMPASLPSQLTMEKTPGYFISESAPSRVHSMNPDTRLVLVVRDPVTRILSDYAQASANAAGGSSRRRNRRNRRRKNRRKHRRRQAGRRGSSIKPIESLAFRSRPGNGSQPELLEVSANWTAVRIGEYARHLANWLAVFPRQQILVLSGERLVADPGAVMEELQRFLGLELIITGRHFYFDRRKGFHCLKKAGRRGKPRCLAGNKGRRHPNLAPELIRRLRQFYAPKNREFYAMTGVNFGWPEL